MLFKHLYFETVTFDKQIFFDLKNLLEETLAKLKYRDYHQMLRNGPVCSLRYTCCFRNFYRYVN